MKYYSSALFLISASACCLLIHSGKAEATPEAALSCFSDNTNIHPDGAGIKNTSAGSTLYDATCGYPYALFGGHDHYGTSSWKIYVNDTQAGLNIAYDVCVESTTGGGFSCDSTQYSSGTGEQTLTPSMLSVWKVAGNALKAGFVEMSIPPGCTVHGFDYFH